VRLPALYLSKLLFLLIVIQVFSASLQGQASAQGQTLAAPLVTQAIDEAKLITLHGNVHPLAQARYDTGAVPDSFCGQPHALAP
jgi:hypothetical protein